MFCPNEAPGLSDVYGDEFESLYEKYKSENRQRKTIKARELWDKILESQIETGNPYMLYKDAANKKSNQKNLGTIKSSNLCVSGDTLLLTSEGYQPIASLVDQKVKVWNGEEWSKSIVRKTGENQDLFRVTIYDNHGLKYEIDCTEYHKWFLDDGTLKRTNDLHQGDVLEKFKLPQIAENELKFYYIDSIISIGVGDTYCLHEPIRDRVIFNGIMTGNCTEIIEYTDKDETAVCNLASIALPEFVKGNQFDFDQLGYITSVITRNLNKVIDINYHPIKEAENSNLKHRPIGIGVQGLADVFAKLKMPFDSKEAAALNKDIFECIYYHALLESAKIAYETQPYSSFKGSPASEGILQFDMWGAETSDNLRYDWVYLKECIKNHGIANSLLIAPMPTASTAQILGNNECFEPYTSNIYVRRVLSGEFIVVNKHLVNDLDSLGIWSDEVRRKIIANNGSVQGIDEIPKDIQDIYKTVWEIKQKSIIDMAADRGAFICQSQSMNIFMDQPTENKLTSMHFYGWKKGLKTGMYYLRTKPARSAIKFTVDPIEKKTKEDYDALVCSIENPENCIMCSG